jgi:hypothetical protein
VIRSASSFSFKISSNYFFFHVVVLFYGVTNHPQQLLSLSRQSCSNQLQLNVRSTYLPTYLPR